jgi:hypothetical protein
MDIVFSTSSHITRGKLTFVSVQRLARGSAGHLTGAPLPDTADLPPTAYVLVFGDKAGRTGWEL